MAMLKVLSTSLILSCLSISWAHQVHKRSDDVNTETLNTLVENQAARIQTLESKLTTLENLVTQRTGNLDSLVSQLTTKVDTFNKRFGVPVAFTAHMSRGPVTISTSSPFVFDAVTTNIGNGYNPLTGVFTAPVSGLYVFYFQMIDQGSEPTVRAAIMKEGTTLGMTTAEGGPNLYDQGTSLAATRVNKGEQVFVKYFSGGTALQGAWWNAFAGFLVMPDTV